MCPAPPAPPGHSFSEDRLVGYALHRLPGAPQGPGQLHQNSGERHDPRRDDPQGEGLGLVGGGISSCFNSVPRLWKTLVFREMNHTTLFGLSEVKSLRPREGGLVCSWHSQRTRGILDRCFHPVDGVREAGSALENAQTAPCWTIGPSWASFFVENELIWINVLILTSLRNFNLN